jgi:hypothetical protein
VVKNNWIVVLLPWIHFSFHVVVDTCVLQPPITTSGEIASAPQVLPKGPVVRALWCVVRVEPWVFPYAKFDDKVDSKACNDVGRFVVFITISSRIGILRETK